MLGIEAIAFHLPEGRVDLLNKEVLERFDVTKSFLTDKTGFTKIARRDDGQEPTDLAMPAVIELMEKTGVRAEEFDYCVFVTQNPDQAGLPHASAVLHDKLGLSSACPVFDLSLGCSGWVHGVLVLKALMQQDGRTRGLLVTCDPYSKIIGDNDRDTILLFGDGAAATLLSDKPVWSIGSSDLGTASRRFDAIQTGVDGKLHMKGREVFNFAAQNVPNSIKRTLEKEGIDLAQVDRFVLHQGSKYIVDTIAKRLDVSDKAVFTSADYGNTVSSSIPIALMQGCEETDNVVVVSGFGVGLAWATAILRRTPTEREAQ